MFPARAMTNIPIPAGLDTKLCVLGDHVLTEIPSVLRQLWPGGCPVVIADENTWAAAGREVHELLATAGLQPAPPHVFPARPLLHADYTHVGELIPPLTGRVPVAIGSGTINDLVKRASVEANTPGYLCVATAPSVDGYTSFGAALTVNGVKKTVPCPAPVAILADNRVIGSAPLPMIAAGYADLAAKIVAGADWHIAAALGITPYEPVAWELVQKDLQSWLADPEGVRDRRPAALAALFTGLAATGFAMQRMRDSRPASGAEHLFSHVWEMEGLTHQGEAPSHGFKVAIGTLISTAMMTAMFAWTTEEARQRLAAAPAPTAQERQAQIDAFLQKSPFAAEVSQTAMGKLLTGPALAERRQAILKAWPELQAKVRAQLLPLDELRRRFQILGCPVQPADIGLDEALLRRGIMVGGMIRNRYTFLDLLYEIGQLEEQISNCRI